MGLQFLVVGSQQIEFKFYAHANYAFRLEVDDKRITDLPVVAGLTVNSHNTVRFDLGDAAPHRIKLWMNACALSRVYVGPAGSIWPIAPKGGRLFGLSDSTMQGASAGTGQEADSWLLGLGRLLGIDDVWNGAIGGTGPLSTNGATSGNYLTRVATDVIPAAPSLVVLGGPYNDLIVNGQSNSAIANQYAAILDALAGVPSKPSVIGIGAFDPLGVNGANYTSLEAALLPVFAAKGVPYVSPITGNTYDRSGAVIATAGGPWINAANKATLIAGDNTHQTDVGKKATYMHVIEAIRPLMAA
jgi:lysophospholipase L1-like esterase